MKVVIHIIVFIVISFGLFNCGGNKNLQKNNFSSEKSRHIEKQKAWDYFLKGLWDEFEYRYEDALLNYYMASSFDSTNSAIYLAIAENEIRLEIYDVALLFINKSLKLKPEDKKILQKKADILSKLNRYKESYGIYKSLLARFPTNSYYQFMAKNLINITKDSIEEKWYYQFLADNLKTDQSLIQLAQYYFVNNQIASAQEIYEALYYKDSSNLNVSIALADCYIYRGWYGKASDILEKILKDHDDRHLVLKLLDIYQKLELDQKSIDFLTEYLIHNDNSPHLMLILSDFYLRTERFDESLTILDKYGSVYSNQLSPFFFELKARTFLGKFQADSTQTFFLDSATVVLQNSLNYHIKDENLWLLLAYTQIENTQPELAISTLKKAEPLFPNSARLLVLHSQILFEQNLQLDAIPVLEKLLTLEPDNRMAISFLANVYMNEKQYELSDSLFQTGLRINPDDALLLNNWAYSYAEREEKLDLAYDMVNQALSKEPENPAYLDTKGWILFKQKKYKKSFKFIFKAYQINQNDIEILEHLGDVFWKLNKKSEAKKYWEMAIELDPENTNLHNKMEKGL